MKQLKKLLGALLVVALVLLGICIMEPQMKEVQAQETKAEKVAPEQDGKVFAGYYVDDEYKITSNIEGGYEKFVDEGVLSLKMQLKNNEDGSYDLRLVSTVDTLNYKNVGFKIGFDQDGNGTFEKNEISDWTTREVAHRVDATVTYEDENVKVPYNYSPKVIDTKSEYFITGIMEGIQGKYKENDFWITPFWTTLDGTRVEGQSRWFSINDVVNTNINIPVEMTEEEYASATIGTAGFTIGEQYYDGKYAHFNLTVADKTALPSASAVLIGNKSVIYRNLESKGTANANLGGAYADRTWYTAYPADETEYVIANAAELWGMADLPVAYRPLAGKKVYLVADIELNDVTKVDWTTGVVTDENYTPMVWKGAMNGNNRVFQGTFDGQMHSIKGLYMPSGGIAAGLFQVIDTGSTIKNLKLEQSYIKGVRLVGGIVGQSQGGTIDTVYNAATVISTTDSGAYGTGGIVGYVSGNTTINNCWNAGRIVDEATTATWHYLGGVVGNINGAGVCATIKNCLNTGIVQGYSTRANNIIAGGIVGGTQVGGGSTVKMEYCIGAGAVKNSAGYAGLCSGLIGYGAGGTIRNCSSSYLNAVVSRDGASCAQINFTQQTTAAALYGVDGWTTTLVNDDYWVAITGGNPELKSFRSMSTKAEADVSAVVRPADTSWYDIAPTESEYTLYTEEEYKGLIAIAGDVRTVNGTQERQNFTGKTIKLGADLVLNEGDAENWESNAPVRSYSPFVDHTSGNFDGKFDGQGHSISGLYINSTAAYTSMFGYVGANCIIQDFKLLNSYIVGGQQSGVIVGRSNGCDISGVYTDAIFASASNRIGGIVGSCWANETTVSDCCFAGEMKLSFSAQPVAGGIVGENVNATVIVENCLFDGTITSTSSAYAQKLGGIFGDTNGSSDVGVKTEIKHCLSTGKVTSNSPNHGHEGSIAGFAADTTASHTTSITDCYALDTTHSASYWLGAEASGRVDGQLSEAQLTGADGYVWTTLDENAWVAVKGGTPQLKSFQTTVAADVPNGRVDTSWYDQGTASGDTYTLNDAGDFFGFVQLSQTVDFAGQTVKIADGVTEIDLKDVLCKPICAYDRPFAGTFDGNNATIKGLNIKSNKNFVAMFGGVSGEVKNFNLVDSYIESTYINESATDDASRYAQYVASIVGRLWGTVTNVSSDAKVVCNGWYAGGLVGQTWTGAQKLSQCSFSGEVYMVRADATRVGGLICETRVATVVEHCLFDGSIISNKEAYDARTGGIVGYVAAETQLNDCLSAGTISFPKATTTINNAGSVVGYVTGDNANNLLKITGPVQVTKDCYYDADHNVVYYGSGTATVEGADKITVFAESAYGTSGNLSSEYWQTVPGGTPILK